MRGKKKAVVIVAAILVLAAGYAAWWNTRYYVIERTEYSEQALENELGLADDLLSDKNPAFDETLVDTRAIDAWEVNQSAAVIRLDCSSIKPDTESELLSLHASYADAAQAAKQQYRKLLVSANMLDGAAKQFDDGLYAALDLACYQGALGIAPGSPDFIKAVFEKLPAGSAPRPFLAAALRLAGMKVPLEAAEESARDKFLANFERDQARSKPISFYTWTPELQNVWRFFRFLQFEFDEITGLDIPHAVAAVLEGNPDLLEHYRALNAFYGRLTNPLICLPVDALIGNDDDLAALAARHGARRVAVAVFPPSTSRETELFDQLFAGGLPSDANVMLELIRAIRSGTVDLAPGEGDGWYQYQVHALETMLLPAKGQENEKLQLTVTYKKRLVEAFKALVTKRRETHARQLAETTAAAEAPLEESAVSPRLRVEPCATFYLRTARAYAFLQDFLEATVGHDRLNAMHGLTQDGQRPKDLASELDAMRLRFYGYYAIACEDIGMRPQFMEGEVVDADAAKAASLAWLDTWPDDPDLACDTRVAIPIVIDPIREVTRLWATIGVRLAKLDASFARPPKVRPEGTGDPWKDVEPYQLSESHYVLPVDEFVEFEIPGSNALTREELRVICDRYATREDILECLGQ